jgi:hypothetical protein
MLSVLPWVPWSAVPWEQESWHTSVSPKVQEKAQESAWHWAQL